MARVFIFQNPRFDALRNAIYHTERRAFFDLLNRALNFLVIALGAGVVAKAADRFNFNPLWLELAVVFVATAQLVFDFGGRARMHEFLQLRYYELLGEMERSSLESDDERAAWSAKLITIAGGEPITMRALDALAYNAALDALYDEPEDLKKHRLHVPWCYRRLRHFIGFQGVQFVPEALPEKS